MAENAITTFKPSTMRTRRYPTELASMLLTGLSDPLEELVNVLTDAMHWCDVHNEDFQHAYRLARAQYLAEFRLFLAEERNRV